jgi:SlyX protein
MSSEERITNLEVKLSFTEDLIENLNQTIYKQQQQIEFLYREMKSLKEQMSASGSEGLGSGNDARDLRDEIPPHY